MDAVASFFLFASGELCLAAIGLRIALWVALGWRQWRVAERSGPAGPGGPHGGLRVLPGGGAEAPPEAAPLRKAA